MDLCALKKSTLLQTPHPFPCSKKDISLYKDNTGLVQQPDKIVVRFTHTDLSLFVGLSIPKSVPRKWVVDCKHVGKGITALKYLSKYLYRGVISEKNIVSNQNGRVTFKYIESKTGNTRYRTLKGEDFLRLIMQHVLPKGFRRVRDYGFLHSNAKKLLALVQLILHVMIKGIGLRPRPVFKCPCCKSPMVILGFRQAVFKSG